jgi:hypothetical protein
VKRIDIYYGGEHYSVGGRELADVQADIAAGLAVGGAGSLSTTARVRTVRHTC